MDVTPHRPAARSRVLVESLERRTLLAGGSSFLDLDIGSPSVAGSASLNSATGAWVVRGGGTHIGGTSDQFHFSSVAFTGDVAVVARLDSLTDTGDFAKAGLMIRDGNAADAKFAFLSLTPPDGVGGEGANFEFRGDVGASASVSGSIPSAAAPSWLRLTRSGNTFDAAVSSDGQSWTSVGAGVVIPMSLTVRVGLAVDADSNSALNVARFSNASALPLGWTDRDLGSPVVTGWAAVDGATWTIVGSGSDIGNTSDQFNYTSKDLAGDGSVVARVNLLSNTDPWAKSGVMIRDGMAANASFADLVVTPGNGISFQWRTSAGGSAGSVTVPGSGGNVPVWLRLDRAGNTFSASYSPDGNVWTSVGSPQTIAMSVATKAGLAVTSRNASVLNTTIFSKVSVLPVGWLDGDVGGPNLTGSASFDGNTWTLRGGGGDVYDQFNLASRSMTGDGSVIARVGAVSFTNASAKAGVMIRERVAGNANAAFAGVVVTAGNSIQFQYRVSDGVSPSSISVGGLVSAPAWVKIDRTGGKFAASFSYDGVFWSQIGEPVSIAMGATTRFGLVSAGMDDNALSVASFTNVNVLPVGWSHNDIGYTLPAGSATFDGSRWAVYGGGGGVGGTSDQFSYASQSFIGDVTLVTRIDGQTSAADSGKAGLMIRDGVAAGAPFAWVSLSPAAGQGVRFEYRTASSTSVKLSGSANAAAGDAVWLKLVRAGNTFTAFQSADGSGWTQVGSAIGVTMSTTANVGLAVTAGTGSVLNRATFSKTSVLSPGWSATDIGNPAAAGSSTFDGLSWNVRGGGTDIYGTSDQFHFTSRSHNGDVTLVAQVGSASNTGTFAKAGLMVRDGTGANASYAYVFVTPNTGSPYQGAVFEYRNGTGAASSGGGNVVGVVAPAWLKLVRSGNSFTAFYSANGTNWTQIGSARTAVMGSTVQAGLAVSANNATGVNAATFANVSVAAQQIDPFLKQNGRNMRDGHGSGDIVALRGVNFGSWLMYEWAFGAQDGSQLPDAMNIYDTLTTRFGVAGRNRLEQAYRNNWITTADLDLVKAMGLNVIRVPFWWLNVVEKDGTWRSDAFTHLDWIVNEAWKRNIYTILDFHGLPGGQTGWASAGHTQDYGKYWGNDFYKNLAATIWSKIATHFKGHPGVAAYDLINEPAEAPSRNTLWTTYNSLYATVRAADPDHTIQIEGNWDWDSLPNPATYGWTNIAYHTHNYAFNTDGSYNPTLQRIKDVTDATIWQVQQHASWNIAAFVGEFAGISNPESFTYQLNKFNTNGIGWASWTWKSNRGQNSPWTVISPINNLWEPNLRTDSLTTILQAYTTQRTASNFQPNSLVYNALSAAAPFSVTSIAAAAPVPLEVFSVARDADFSLVQILLAEQC